ncbi:MAG: exonuclease domain-containing protein [Collinsella sp.]|nr:exonuclease domain-containing protein [Collinsella sp.]
MIYGANGEIFKNWDDAKSKVESVPADAAPGTPRTYPIDAYVEDENGNRVQVNGFWFSELSEETRKPLLRELGLPITKKIMYRDRDTVSQVLDFKIEDVWDRWCNVVVKLANGTITNRTHSWYFSDMNSVPEKTNAATPKKKKAVAKKKTAETSDDVPGLPNSYVVFDLETTGLNCTDCQIAEIGAIKVRDGKVVDTFSQLVYIDFPMPQAALNVNNITDEMLADAPHATEAMKSFIEFIGEGAVLVGHNIKRYDLPIMKRVATACRLDFDYAEAIDTYQLAQLAWPHLERWSMQVLREFLNIKNDDAHRALADCEDEMSVYDAIRDGVKSGELSIEPPRRRASRPGAVYNKNWGNKVKAKDIKPTTDKLDESHPLFGKLVVVSGDVAMFDGDRVRTWQAIANVGGTPQDNITKKTGYLVCGEGAGMTKRNKAEQYGIEIISADEFENMFKGEE